MTERVHESPNLIYAVGTQVVCGSERGGRYDPPVRTLLVVLAGLLASVVPAAARETTADPALAAALARAGANRPELERALRAAPAAQREGMRYLVRHMPAADLRALKADYLLENVRLAYAARAKYWLTSPTNRSMSSESTSRCVTSRIVAASPTSMLCPAR